MTSFRPIIINNGTQAQIPDADSLLVGTGIDVSAAGALTIGAAAATSITIGSASITTDFPGPVMLTGDVTTVGGTTFATDATFEGNVTFGNGPSDTVTFAETTTVIGNIAFNGAGYRITNLANGTDANDAVNLSQLSAVEGFKYDQEVFVAKNGSDLTGTGAALKPFASISAALAAITDAAPSKRYAILVQAGSYTEVSALNLKPDVFIVGATKDAVRIQADSFGLDSSFSGAGDKRSGITNAIIVGACSFDMSAVTSNEGKLFFEDVSFSNSFSLTGNSSINQAQIDSCTFFNTITFSGFNVGVFSNNRCFTSIVLNQHPSVATVLNATGGFADSLTVTASVSNFNRRCSVFTRGLKFDGTVTVNGPSAYVDYTVGSLPSNGATVLNGGNLVSVDFGANKALSNLVFPTAVNNPIMPATTNATNFGDWGKQWFWNFGYLHASTGTDCYLASYPSSFGAESAAGKNVFIIADAAGLASNINGGGVGLYSNNATGTGASGIIEVETGTAVNGNSGNIMLLTGTVSGAGIRGVISLNGRQVDVNSSKIVNVANGVNANDAVNKSQLDNTVASFSGGSTGLTPATPTTGAVELGGTLAIANGGTGLTSAPANGQLLIGNGTGYTLATLSEGEGIEITEASGSITVAATEDSVKVSLITTGLSDGDVVCVDTAANNTVKKADADTINTARVLGVVFAANKVQVSGIALATFDAAPSLGGVAFLSNTEGVLTTVAPTSGVVSEVGIVVSAAESAGKYSVLLQVKPPVELA